MTQPDQSSLLAACEAALGDGNSWPLSTFIARCMTDPMHGYYQQQEPFGTSGDFITAPEISGLFGEMCGLYLAHMYEVAGAPADAAVLELGPGRGSLMRDMHHVWQTLMPDLAAAPIHLVEASARLRSAQATTLAPTGQTPTWHDDVTHLPAKPLFGIANEFFDALPIDQIICRNGSWHHRHVGLIDGNLAFVDGPAISTDQLPATLPAAQDGAIAEFCPDADRIMDDVAGHVARFGGAVLIIDYGRRGNEGDSLQAVADHKPVDIFHAPGQADLSHWVDFAALGQRAAMAGCRLIGPVPQGRFLMRIGLAARAEQAAASGDPETRRSLLAAVDRLTSPAQMGEAFKVALLVPNGEGIPPGFEGDRE